MLVRGKAGLQEYTEENIKDDRIKALAQKIVIEEDPVIQASYPEKRTTIVEIRNKDGQIWSSTVDYAKGDPLNPMSDEDLREKFKEVTHNIFSGEKADKVMNWVMSGDPTEKPIVDLTKMLSY